jgi:large subunit ribosomal protein L7/L12
VRELRPGLGLKEARDLVENAPQVIREGLGPAEAEGLRAQLEAAGAKVAVQGVSPGT